LNAAEWFIRLQIQRRPNSRLFGSFALINASLANTKTFQCDDKLLSQKFKVNVSASSASRSDQIVMAL